MSARKKKNGVFAVHAFVATRDHVCSVCGTAIHKNEHYIVIEPADRKRASFVTCTTCGAKVKA